MVHLPLKKCYHVSKLCVLVILVITVLGLLERYRGGKKSTSAATELEVELERQIVEDEARIIPNLGEGGIPANLQGDGKRLGEESEKKYAINTYLSDRIPYNRTLKDFRNPSCKRVVYDAELPSVSVIIIFHNEPYSVVIRTLWSVINSARRDNAWFRNANYIDKKTGKGMNLGYKGQDLDSPFVYLKEIILVDDNSTLPELKDKLSHYVRTRLPPDLIRILRLPDRVGLTRARLAGARYASGDVLVFLDAHCESQPDWMRPLLQRIKDSPHAVVVPVIDVIEASDFYYSVLDPVVFQIGGFTFSGHFIWIDVPEREKKRRGSDISPTWSPTMAGGLFAIKRSYYWELGAYDEQMAGWGGENLEMSFRIWQCGGTLETIPCSRVGHVFRSFHPYGLPAQSDTHGINTARMAEVWMDDYAELFYLHRPDLRKSDKIGDVTHRRVLREKLKCKSFQWYLDNIYKEKFVPVRDVDAFGRFMNPVTGLCLDTLQREQEPAPLGVYPCHAALQPTQYLSLSLAAQLRDEERCAHVHAHARRDGTEMEDEGRAVMMMSCRPHQRGQKWRLITSTQQIQNLETHLCLESPYEAGADVIARRCDEHKKEQRWHIDYTENSFDSNNIDPGVSSQEVKLQKLRGQRRISRSLMFHSDGDSAATRRRKNKKNKFVLKLLRSINGTEQHLEADIHCKHRTLYPNDTFVRDIVSILNEKDIKVINNGRVFEKNRVYEVARKKKKNSRSKNKFNEIIVPGQRCSLCPNENGEKYLCCKSRDNTNSDLLIVNIENVQASVSEDGLGGKWDADLSDASEDESTERWVAISIEADHTLTNKHTARNPIDIYPGLPQYSPNNLKSSSSRSLYKEINRPPDNPVIHQAVKLTTDSYVPIDAQNIIPYRDNIRSLSTKPHDDYLRVIGRLAVNAKNMQDAANLNSKIQKWHSEYEKFKNDYTGNVVGSNALKDPKSALSRVDDTIEYINTREERWLPLNVKPFGWDLKRINPLIQSTPEKWSSKNIVPVSRDYLIPQNEKSVPTDSQNKINEELIYKNHENRLQNINEINNKPPVEERWISHNIKPVGGDLRYIKPDLNLSQEPWMSRNIVATGGDLSLLLSKLREAATQNTTTVDVTRNYIGNEKNADNHILYPNKNDQLQNNISYLPSIAELFKSRNAKPVGGGDVHLQQILDATLQQMLKKALSRSNTRPEIKAVGDKHPLLDDIENSRRSSNNTNHQEVQTANDKPQAVKQNTDLLLEWIMRNINAVGGDYKKIKPVVDYTREQFLSRNIIPAGRDFVSNENHGAIDYSTNNVEVAASLHSRKSHSIHKSQKPVDKTHKNNIIPHDNPLNLVLGSTLPFLANNISYVLIPSSKLAALSNLQTAGIVNSNIRAVGDHSQNIPYDQEIIVSRELTHKKRAVDSKDVSHNEADSRELDKDREDEPSNQSLDKHINVERHNNKPTHSHLGLFQFLRYRKTDSQEELKKKLDALKWYWEKSMISDKKRVVRVPSEKKYDTKFKLHKFRSTNFGEGQQKKNYDKYLNKESYRNAQDESKDSREKTQNGPRKYVSIQLREVAPHTRTENSREISQKYQVINLQKVKRKTKPVKSHKIISVSNTNELDRLHVENSHEGSYKHRATMQSNEHITRNTDHKERRKSLPEMRPQHSTEPEREPGFRKQGSNERTYLKIVKSLPKRHKVHKSHKSSDDTPQKPMKYEKKNRKRKVKISKTQIEEVLRRFRNIKPKDREKLKMLRMHWKDFVQPTDLINVTPKKAGDTVEILHSNTPPRLKLSKDDVNDVIFMGDDNWGLKLEASPEESMEKKYNEQHSGDLLYKSLTKTAPLPINKLLGSWENTEIDAQKNLHEMEEEVSKHMKHGTKNSNAIDEIHNLELYMARKPIQSHEKQYVPLNSKEIIQNNKSNNNKLNSQESPHNEHNRDTDLNWKYINSLEFEISQVQHEKDRPSIKPNDFEERIPPQSPEAQFTKPESRFTIVHENKPVNSSSGAFHSKLLYFDSHEAVIKHIDSREFASNVPTGSQNKIKKFKIVSSGSKLIKEADIDISAINNPSLGLTNNKLYDSKERHIIVPDISQESIKTNQYLKQPDSSFLNNKLYDSLEVTLKSINSVEAQNKHDSREAPNNKPANLHDRPIEVQEDNHIVVDSREILADRKLVNTEDATNSYDIDTTRRPGKIPDALEMPPSSHTESHELLLNKMVLANNLYDSLELQQDSKPILPKHIQDNVPKVPAGNKLSGSWEMAHGKYRPISETQTDFFAVTLRNKPLETVNQLLSSIELLHNVQTSGEVATTTLPLESKELQENKLIKSPQTEDIVVSRETTDKSNSQKKTHKYLSIDLEKVSSKAKNSQEVLHKYKIVNLRHNAPNKAFSNERNARESREFSHTHTPESHEKTAESQETTTDKLNSNLFSYIDFL